jgi:hypothetical protein
MTPPSPPTLDRLARANPVIVDEERGHSPVAQTALARILASERDGRRRRPFGRRRGIPIVAIAALLVIGGGAVAATDPLGLFRSPNPGTAIYGVDPSRHVRPPTETSIACPAHPGPVLRCGAGLGGQRYMLIDHVESNGGSRLTRANMLRALEQERRSGLFPARTVRRVEADLAAVSDGFLAHLREMLRFGTLSTSLTSASGRPVAPPPGVPALIVCEPDGSTLGCRDLNGDDHAAIGSGIYQALPSAGWLPAPPHQPDPGWELEVAILGRPPTPAELRFMTDLLRVTTTSSGATPSRPQRVAPRASSG